MALPIFGFGTAAPTSTTQYNEVGSYIRNSTPAANGVIGWVCTAAGYPGTWVAEGITSPTGLATVTAAAALAATSKYHVITGAGPYTLASAAAVSIGSEAVIISNNVLVTLTAAANQTFIGNSTVAANTAIRVVSNGTNTWFRSN